VTMFYLFCVCVCVFDVCVLYGRLVRDAESARYVYGGAGGCRGLFSMELCITMCWR